MLARIKELALQCEDDTINIRRDIHKYAETGGRNTGLHPWLQKHWKDSGGRFLPAMKLLMRNP